MINITLTPGELRIIHNALETEYYHAKDEGNSTVQQRITALETKLSKEENA